VTTLPPWLPRRGVVLAPSPVGRILEEPARVPLPHATLEEGVAFDAPALVATGSKPWARGVRD
jgi:hypothetical protein